MDESRSGGGRHRSQYGLSVSDRCLQWLDVKTTLDIEDELLARAKQLAKESGKPLRAIVEDGLRATLAAEEQEQTVSYALSDCGFGDPNGEDPLELLSWQDLRDEIY